MRRMLLGLVVLATLAIPAPAGAVPTGELVHTKATLRCLDEGGARATLWVRNVSDRPVLIAPDIHFLLTLIRGDQHEGGPVVFMTPVPDFADLDPHEVSRFKVPLGESFEDEPPVDLSADRLRLRVEVYLEGHAHAAVSRFVYPGCPPPVTPGPAVTLTA